MGRRHPFGVKKGKMEKKFEIKSILNSILVELEVPENQDFKRVKKIILERIHKSRVQQRKKNKMIININKCRNYEKLIICVYNLILKFEGQGVLEESLRGGRIWTKRTN